jgi:integrase
MGVATAPVERLDTSMVRQLLRETKASPSEIGHLYGSLCRFCDWLVEEQILEANPCASVPRNAKPKQRCRDYVPSVAELRRVLAAAESEPEVVRDALCFLLLVPLRLREATGLTWGEVDFDERWIRISAARMKARDTHELPLSDEALAILRHRRGDAPPKADALVFPSGRGKPLDGWTRVMGRIRQALGQTLTKNPCDSTRRADVISIHDFRRGFGTHLAAQFDESLLNLMLAHRPASRAGAGAAYLRAKRLSDRPRVMEVWAELIFNEKRSPNAIPFAKVGG